MKSDGQAEKSKTVYHEFEPGFGTDLFCFSAKARPEYLSHLDTVDYWQTGGRVFEPGLDPEVFSAFLVGVSHRHYSFLLSEEVWISFQPRFLHTFLCDDLFSEKFCGAQFGLVWDSTDLFQMIV